MKRNSIAVWKGSGKDGNGFITTQSKVLKETPYSFNSRFAEGAGTNPEELLAAAHAGCFTMKLTFVLNEAGFVPEELETTCEINFENGAIVGSHLSVKAKIKGISQEVLNESVKDAEVNCPVSRVLNAKITTDAILI
jgi:lipoyl-dependent peroxiredoxin